MAESWGEGPVCEAERDTQLFSLPSGEGDAAQAARGGVLREAHPARRWQELAFGEHPTRRPAGATLP